MPADLRLLPASIADTRSKAVLEILDRMAAVDLTPLLVNRIDSAPATALYALAWQWSVDGEAGWDLTTTEAQKRALLKRAGEFNQFRGTIWAIQEVLKILGYLDVQVDEGVGRIRHNGVFRYNAVAKHSGDTNWAHFRVRLGKLADAATIPEATQRLIKGAVNKYKNARSWLVALHWSVPSIEDVIGPQADDPMGITQRTFYLHNAVNSHNGAIVYGGSGTMELGPV